jgi:hypothetical protein
MSLRNTLRALLGLLCLALVMAPEPVLSCSACFGRSDSPLAQGMNMGILSLLIVVVFVLGGVAAFFIYLAKKAAATAAINATPPTTPTAAQKIS